MSAFSNLTSLGYVVDSVTSDKHGSIVAAVKTAFPHVSHQYCMVHIQRRCQALLTKNPETLAGQDLLDLVLVVNKVKTHKDKIVFLKWLERYEKRYKSVLNHRTYFKDPLNEKRWMYTHKNLRLSFKILASSTNNMFFYLDDVNISKDTNGLEAEFTHLKNKLNAHRGLTRARRRNFTSWYWFLKSKSASFTHVFFH